MSDDDVFGFGGLFDDVVPAAGMNAPPAAPPLLGPNGARFVVPDYLKQSIIIGSGQEALHELDGASSRFPIPLLRRALSLSKNTPHSLQGRLADLSADLIAANHAHEVRLLELETSMRSERLAHAERTGRIETERAAVEKALAQIAKAEADAAAAKVAAATATSSSASPASTTSRSPSCLPASRSPGECSITGEETGCGVCLCADRDTLVAPCGHVALCFGCADAIRKSRNPECPFCRSKITAVYKLFVV